MHLKNQNIILILDFKFINNLNTSWGHLIKFLSKKFGKVYIVNTSNLYVFNKKNINIKKFNIFFPKNIILSNPINIIQFKKIFFDKNVLIINNIKNSFNEIKILWAIRRIKQIQITSAGNIQMSDVPEIINHPIKSLKFIFNKKISKLFIKVLSFIKILPQIDVRFTSNKIIIDNIKKNKIQNFLYKKGLFFVKKLVLVNSRAYDLYQKKKYKKSNQFIVHIDASLNYNHETILVGERNKETITKHYFYLEKFLKKLSYMFKKKVIVCIHPSYNLSEHKKYFKNFKVLKYKTREFIYKAYLVTTFDSSSVVDAVLLKKKIIGIHSVFMNNNEKRHSLSYANHVGYLYLDTIKDYNITKKQLLINLNKKIDNYKKYIHDHIYFNKSKTGLDQILEYIKNNYY